MQTQGINNSITKNDKIIVVSKTTNWNKWSGFSAQGQRLDQKKKKMKSDYNRRSKNCRITQLRNCSASRKNKKK